MTDFPRLRQYLSSRAWAMERSAFLAMVEVLERRISGEKLSAEEIEARTVARSRNKEVTKPGSVAVIPLVGIMEQRTNVNDISSQMSSTEQFGKDVEAAANNPDVGSIVLDVDSPGGSVFGLIDAAAKIREARTKKPVTAVANSWAASAAYWLSSQAGELVAAPGSELGSIGVYTMHEDISEMATAEGYKVTFVASAPHKVEGHPFEPLGEEVKSDWQAKVDAHHQDFVRDVAKGRGVSQSRVNEDFGGGRMLMAADAVKVGMADRVATLDTIISEHANGLARKRRSKAKQAQVAVRARMVAS